MYTTKQEKGTNFLLTESGEFFRLCQGTYKLQFRVFNLGYRRALIILRNNEIDTINTSW